MSDTNNRHRFKERVITQELSPEFLRQFAGVTDDEDAKQRVVAAAQRLERSYSVVAEIEEYRDFYVSDVGYTLRVIPTMDADPEEIQRGIQSVQYWVAEGDR